MENHYGYARVSTGDQTHELQIDALLNAGVHPDNIVIETASGAKQRPLLRALIDKLNAGDALIVWRLDRLGRSVPDLYGLVTEIEAKGAHFRSIKDSIDTATATGRLMLGMLAVLAQFERDRLIERTKAGVEAAKRNGRRFGRPPKLTDSVIRQVQLAHADPSLTVSSTAESLGISRAPIAPPSKWLRLDS